MKNLFPKAKFNDEKEQLTMDEILKDAHDSLIENKKIIDKLGELKK